jgi:hypothetical protein
MHKQMSCLIRVRYLERLHLEDGRLREFSTFMDPLTTLQQRVPKLCLEDLRRLRLAIGSKENEVYEQLNVVSNSAPCQSRSRSGATPEDTVRLPLLASCHKRAVGWPTWARGLRLGP